MNREMRPPRIFVGGDTEVLRKSVARSSQRSERPLELADISAQ